MNTPCAKCDKPMNPVEVMLAPICGKCVDREFEKATGIKKGKR